MTHPYDILAELGKVTNFPSPEEAIEHAVKRLAVALVLKETRTENLARLQLIDAYISGQYYPQARLHCSLLGEQPRWRAEAALREAEILIAEAKSSRPNTPSFVPILERLAVYADFFGNTPSWCQVGLEVSELLAARAVDCDELLETITATADDENVVIKALKVLTKSSNREISRRAVSSLFERQPTTELALKVSLAYVEEENFRAALRALERADSNDERIQRALKAVKLKLQ